MDETNASAIQKAREINVDSKETDKDIKLQIYICNGLHNREMGGAIDYVKFNRWSKTVQLPKAIVFFL